MPESLRRRTQLRQLTNDAREARALPRACRTPAAHGEGVGGHKHTQEPHNPHTTLLRHDVSSERSLNRNLKLQNRWKCCSRANVRRTKQKNCVMYVSRVFTSGLTPLSPPRVRVYADPNTICARSHKGSRRITRETGWPVAWPLPSQWSRADAGQTTTGFGTNGEPRITGHSSLTSVAMHIIYPVNRRSLPPPRICRPAPLRPHGHCSPLPKAPTHAKGPLHTALPVILCIA
jgi:hypothetical protein|mmetsp:Transcript_83605/g.139559  ORF Transcript_83605/g.139559 Transcript_83605/m.139559 type:complete len:232 (+) Transcript_83605:14-709(+)